MIGNEKVNLFLRIERKNFDLYRLSEQVFVENQCYHSIERDTILK